jgi:hypothetical protein
VGHALDGFPYAPGRLTTYHWTPQDLDDIRSRFEVKIEKLPDGHYRAGWDEGRYWKTAIEISPEHGYNIVASRGEGTNKKGEFTFTESRLNWRQKAGVWYIHGVTQEVQEVGGVRHREEFEFEDFEVNAVIAGEMFTMSALQLADGSRVIDRRPGVKTRVYHYRKTTERDSDNMLRELETLPP